MNKTKRSYYADVQPFKVVCLGKEPGLFELLPDFIRITNNLL